MPVEVSLLSYMLFFAKVLLYTVQCSDKDVFYIAQSSQGVLHSTWMWMVLYG